MDVKHGQHPITSVPGALAVAVWTVYVLLAGLFYSPDIPLSVWPIGFFGILACLAVVQNFAYWRFVVIVASLVYLSFYVTRVMRMVVLTANFDLSSLPSTLAFYYSASWQVTVAMHQEKGIASSLMHGFLEYAMPVLSLVLIGLILIFRRTQLNAT